MDFLNSIVGRRTQRASEHRQNPPDRNEVAINHLRKLYNQYLSSLRSFSPDSSSTREDIFKILPLFCNAFGKVKSSAILQKFPECHEFAEDVSEIFVSCVSETANRPQNDGSGKVGVALLNFMSEMTDGGLRKGWNLLQTINILADIQESVVQNLLKSNLFSTMVKCITIFVELPSPQGLSQPPLSVLLGATPSEQTKSENKREALCDIFRSIMTKCCRYPCTLQDILTQGTLPYLFSCTTTPCHSFNNCWRKLSADVLLTLSRHNMGPDFISFVKERGNLRLCIHNMRLHFKDVHSGVVGQEHMDPLQVIEMFVPVFCCLKDSCEYQPNLLEEFTRCSGYKFLYDFLLEMDARVLRNDPKYHSETKNAIHQMLNLIYSLCFQGFLDLHPSITEPGPYQDENFQVPIPLGGGQSVKNKEAFQVFEHTFLQSKGVFTGMEVIDKIEQVFSSDDANYFILEQIHTLPTMIEALPRKPPELQEGVFRLFKYVVCSLNYIPSAELAHISLLLQNSSKHLKLTIVVLRNLISLATKNINCREVFREVGVLAILITCLNEKVSDSYSFEPGEALSVSVIEAVRHQSPAETVDNLNEEFMFNLMECLRVLIEGNDKNAQAFRKFDGVPLLRAMLPYGETRKVALRVLSSLINCEGGVEEVRMLLDIMNTTPKIAIGLKYDILKTIRHCFELESSIKTVFREANGFEYTISFISALYGSLAYSRPKEWANIDRREILEYINLILQTISAALEENLANIKHFEENIRFESFSEPLRNLGCFSFTIKTLQKWNKDERPGAEDSKKAYLSFNAEFLTHKPPKDELSTRSCVYAAAQIFQFLRDMAMECTSQDTPLPPILPTKAMKREDQYVPPHPDSVPVLSHPGPILCMMDLLPGIHPSIVNVDVSTVRIEPEATDTTQRPSYENISLRKKPKSEPSSPASIPHKVPLPLPETDAHKMPLPLPETDVSNPPSCPPKPTPQIDIDDMTSDELEEWCLYLQERVATEIYRLALLIQNQQRLSQVGLPGRLLCRCSEALADERHPLHEPLQRTLEKLSYQSMTSADLRNFLRLGNPLFCRYNEIVKDNEYIKINNLLPYDISDLVQGNEDFLLEEDDTLPEFEVNLETDKDEKPLESFGSSLSLGRVQSLVSMTTPRGVTGVQVTPSFVEFNLSRTGYGCLFLPSVFPQQYQVPTNPPSATIGGTGSGIERVFPPQNGITFSTWIRIRKHSFSGIERRDSVSGNGDGSPGNPNKSVDLLTIFQSVAHKKNYSCLNIYLCLSTQTVVVSTQNDRFSSKKGKTISESLEESFTSKKKEKIREAHFDCSVLFEEAKWHHLVIVIYKNVMRSTTASLYLDGSLVDTQKVSYIQPYIIMSLQPVKDAEAHNNVTVHGVVGTLPSRRRILPLIYNLGPTFLFEEPISAVNIKHIERLGPTYIGCFQAPIIKDYASTSLLLGNQGRVLNAIVPEDKIVFGITASNEVSYKVEDINNIFHEVDVKAVTKEAHLKKHDNMTPVKMLPNMATHLSGPSRTVGAAIVGNSGVRTFTPNPLCTLLPSVGGTNVMLGLIAMATTVECLYASVKALVCTVGGNQMALKDMERTGGFKILGMLLRSKSSLINNHILHLVLSLVGTLDYEQECNEIPHPVAFRDLLADLSVWSDTSQDVQRSLLHHFNELLSSGSRNAEMFVNMNIVSNMLHRLLEQDLEMKTRKEICNTMAILFRGCTTANDFRRLGQYLVSTLPEKSNLNENHLPVYTIEQDTSVTMETDSNVDSSSNTLPPSMSSADVEQFVQLIRLRNMLLDLVHTMTTSPDEEVDLECASKLYEALGFDWILLFMHPHIHHETTAKALRILVHLLSCANMYAKFKDGELAGRWLEGAKEFLVDSSAAAASEVTVFYTLLSPKGSNFQSVKAISEATNSMPGFQVLSYLLIHHIESPQTFLLPIGLLLNLNVNNIPPGGKFSGEVLAQLTDLATEGTKKKKKILPVEVVHVLLILLRTLFHQNADGESDALTLITFLRGMYTWRPFHKFAAYAQQQDFVEALTATLFPPLSLKKYSSLSQKASDDSEFIVIEQSDVAQPVVPALERADKHHPDVYSVIQLLVVILMDGLKSFQTHKNGQTTCPIIDTMLEATSSITSTSYQNRFQTVLLNAFMSHVLSGPENLHDLFDLSKNTNKSITGFSLLCQRLVDKLYQGSYTDPSITVYNFMKTIVERARKNAKDYPLSEIHRSFHRVIIHQLSGSPTTSKDCTIIVDTLCLVSSQASFIFHEANQDVEFLGMLVHRLIELESVGSSDNQAELKGYVPSSKRKLCNAANRLWMKLLELKRETLQEFFSIPLPSASSSKTLTESSGIPSVTDSTLFKLHNCEAHRTAILSKMFEEFTFEEASDVGLTQSQKLRSLGRMMSKRVVDVDPKEKAREIWFFIHEYVSVHCPRLIKAVHNLERLLQKKYKRNCDYSLRFTASKWSHIVYELTRERGLWGPAEPSFLDKWMLDSVEGPSRMRKRMCRNPHFYQHYPFVSRKVLREEYIGQHKPPRSHDSVFQHCRSQIFKETSYLSLPVAQVHGQDDLVASLPIDYGIEPSGLTEGNKTVPGSYAEGTKSEEDTEDVSSPTVEGISPPEPINQEKTDDPVNQAVTRMLVSDEKIRFQCKCAKLEGLDAKEGVLLLGKCHFYVIEGITLMEDGGFIDIESISSLDFVPVVPKELRKHMQPSSIHPPIKCNQWNYDAIKEIHKRRYVLRECALEIFSDDGRNHFLIFEKEKMPKVYQKLEALTPKLQGGQLEDLVAGVKAGANVEEGSSRFLLFATEKSLVQKWENGEITNFQYLMHLNTLAGRSYNDLMQYPIFPWVLKDYESESIDLSDPEVFRDLSKPMGAQSETRLNKFIKKYEEPMPIPFPTDGKEYHKYHYNTHYCSAMTVAGYMIRMEPYTRHYLNLQGGHFDWADRAFHSISNSWKSASEQDTSDVRELIPEFYYLPDFLTNENRFLLGVKQSMHLLGDVILPPWAKGDPREFIRINREALESDYVSLHLHEWIDLIFGCKQSGQAAIDAHNVFNPYFYEENVKDIDKMDDSSRGYILNIIHNFGQMPKQLFKKPHHRRRLPTLLTPSIESQLSASSWWKVFYRDIHLLEISKEPVLKVRSEIGQIVAEKHPMAIEKNKLLLPSSYSKFFGWGYNDRSARLCTAEQERTLAIFEGLHQGQILCATAPSETIILTGGDSTVVCVWELKKEGRDKGKLTMQLTQVLYGHTDGVVCLTVSKTYRLIVSGSADATCIIWDLNKMTFIRQLSNHAGPITALTINDLTGDIVTCTRNNVHLWSINGEELVFATITQGPYSSITCCAMSELFAYDKDNVIVVGCSDGVVRVFSMTYVNETHSKQQKEEKKMEKNRSSDSLVEPRRSKGEDQSGMEEENITSEQDLSIHSENPMVSKEETNVSKNSSALEKEQTLKKWEALGPKQVDTSAWNAHKSSSWTRQLVSRGSLSVERKDNATTARVTAIAISKDHRKLFVGDSRGKVYSWMTGDTIGMSKDTAKEENSDKCMICKNQYSTLDKRFHCKECSRAFCHRCLPVESSTIGKKDLCRNCHEKANFLKFKRP